MAEPTKAVFLSYAREDMAAARRIDDALRSHGVEVWFDQEEPPGGEARDAKINQQIGECALFLPVISANTQARGEGPFRREWQLAVERLPGLGAGIPFLVPVAIDETLGPEALVPEEFMRVQWTRLAGALPTPDFVAQVKNLLSGGARRRPSLSPMDAKLTAAPMRTRPPMTKLPPSVSRPAIPVVLAAPPPPPKKKSGRSAGVWILLVVVLLAAGAAAFFFLRPEEPPARPPRPAVKKAGLDAPKSHAPRL